MKTQTVPQVLRCLTLGGYTARVDGNELRIRDLRPLAGPLPANIRANRAVLVSFLNEWAGGVWPPAPGSGLREVQRTLGCGLAGVQGAGEAAFERVA